MNNLSEPSPENIVVEWPFLTSEWQDSVLPPPNHIRFRVVGADHRHTKVEVTLKDLQGLIQHIADKRAARSEGKNNTLENISEEITRSA